MKKFIATALIAVIGYSLPALAHSKGNERPQLNGDGLTSWMMLLDGSGACEVKPMRIGAGESYNVSYFDLAEAQNGQPARVKGKILSAEELKLKCFSPTLGSEQSAVLASIELARSGPRLRDPRKIASENEATTSSPASSAKSHKNHNVH